MKIWGRALIATFAIAAGAVACSTDDLVDDVDVPLGIDDGASDGAQKSAKVDGSSEAKLTLEETGASLTVPKGALDREVTITVARPADEKAVELVKTLKSVKAVASAPYVLTPHGTKFKSAVSLELPVTKHLDRELAVAWLEDENDKEWKVLSEAKVVDGKVRVELKHFSVIVIFDVATAGLDASVPVDVEDDAGEDVEPLLDAGTAPGADAAVDDPRDSEDAQVPVEPPDGAAPVDDEAGSSTSSDASVGRDSGKYEYDAGYYYPDASSATDAASYDPDAYPPYEYDAGDYYDGGYYDPDAYLPQYPDAYVPYEPDAYAPPEYDDAGNPIDAGDEPDVILS